MRFRPKFFRPAVLLSFLAFGLADAFARDLKPSDFYDVRARPESARGRFYRDILRHAEAHAILERAFGPATSATDGIYTRNFNPAEVLAKKVQAIEEFFSGVWKSEADVQAWEGLFERCFSADGGPAEARKLTVNSEIVAVYLELRGRKAYEKARPFLEYERSGRPITEETLREILDDWSLAEKKEFLEILRGVDGVASFFPETFGTQSLRWVSVYRDRLRGQPRGRFPRLNAFFGALSVDQDCLRYLNRKGVSSGA